MNNLKPETIKELQRYIAEKIKERGFEDETLEERLLLLTEEVGELIKACRKMQGMYVDVNKEKIHDLGGELADVVNMIFTVGIELGLDIEKEFLLKEAENDKRIWKSHEKWGQPQYLEMVADPINAPINALAILLRRI